jgi:hypothetical protein
LRTTGNRGKEIKAIGPVLSDDFQERGFFTISSSLADRSDRQRKEDHFDQTDRRGRCRTEKQDSMADERRRFRRFKMKYPTYAALGRDFEKVGRVKDISSEGLAFEYISDQGCAEETGQVEVFLLDENLNLYKFPCTVVYQKELERHERLRWYNGPIVTRKCGVKFGNIAADQRKMLENLMARQALELLQ